LFSERAREEKREGRPTGMKRIHTLLAGLAGLTIAWVALLGTDLLSRNTVLLLPFSAVVSYGLFNLGIVINKVLNFRTYPSEQKALLEDILRAKEALKGKNVFDDE
jgi:hypothetical protein